MRARVFEGAGRAGKQVHVSLLLSAVLRTLRQTDPTLTLGWLEDVTQLATDDEILRAGEIVPHERLHIGFDDDVGIDGAIFADHA